ncbi:hypothetical protein SLEP1_g43542 [Rubroshorea leprosula]|uniref:Uncharacterized protein n=1 Tax=Rubroshorea leprosula TaxID=152421 RepID=A0AAV5LE36_9ROSI|nr:hypothetical protein SLEP1_g43542 [Rubroshorea leprosula]
MLNHHTPTSTPIPDLGLRVAGARAATHRWCRGRTRPWKDRGMIRLSGDDINGLLEAYSPVEWIPYISSMKCAREGGSKQVVSPRGRRTKEEETDYGSGIAVDING